MVHGPETLEGRKRNNWGRSGSARGYRARDRPTDRSAAFLPRARRAARGADGLRHPGLRSSRIRRPRPCGRGPFGSPTDAIEELRQLTSQCRKARVDGRWLRADDKVQSARQVADLDRRSQPPLRAVTAHGVAHVATSHHRDATMLRVVGSSTVHTEQPPMSNVPSREDGTDVVGTVEAFDGHRGKWNSGRVARAATIRRGQRLRIRGRSREPWLTRSGAAGLSRDAA